jgi:hypothetical protein
MIVESHGQNHIKKHIVPLKNRHRVSRKRVTLCLIFEKSRNLVEGHVPQGMEVQVLSSAQAFRIKNPLFFGDFLFPELGIDRHGKFWIDS